MFPLWLQFACELQMLVLTLKHVQQNTHKHTHTQAHLLWLFFLPLPLWFKPHYFPFVVKWGHNRKRAWHEFWCARKFKKTLTWKAAVADGIRYILTLKINLKEFFPFFPFVWLLNFMVSPTWLKFTVFILKKKICCKFCPNRNLIC